MTVAAGASLLVVGVVAIGSRNDDPEQATGSVATTISSVVDDAKPTDPTDFTPVVVGNGGQTQQGPDAADQPAEGDDVGASSMEATSKPAVTATADALTVDVTPSRDPWQRPFTSTSIWNMPIGADAEYVPANLPYTERQLIEHSFLLRTTTADPVQPILRTTSWRNRCDNPGETGRSLHLPDGWTPLSVEGTKTPNNPGVFLQPDGRTLVNVSAMERCDPTGPLFAQWPQSKMHVTDLYGDGRYGAHGGSNLSELGGAIRPGELTGDEPIRHALDLLIWSEHLFWGGATESSFRWPASRSDAYAGPDRYRGDNPELVMGSLLAIPPDMTAEDLGIETAVGRKLFDALQDHGAYVTDDSAWDATYLGVDSEAIGTFEWNDDTVDDMADMVMALHVVANSGPDSIGGGGEPRVDLLPPLDAPDVAFDPSE